MEPTSKLELCKAVDSNWAYVVSTEESLFYLGHGGSQLYPEGLSPSAR
jgi:hypothetical protein